MTARSLPDTIGRRLWATGLALAISAALVATMLLTGSGSPAGASVADTASTLDSALAADAPTGDRARLRKDLKAARALEGDARRAAVQKIRAAAADGDYGDKIAQRADRRSDRRAAVMALLPDDLQADLAKVEDAPADQRKAMREDVRAKALDGGYGDKVKEAAELLKDRWAK